MFTHPSLLRTLTRTSDFLRQSGESRWARDLKALADDIRKQGWTAQSLEQLVGILDGEPSLGKVSFGSEHERWLHGEKGVRQANERLRDLCLDLRELSQIPTVEAAKPGPRPRSPDLD